MTHSCSFQVGYTSLAYGMMVIVLSSVGVGCKTSTVSDPLTRTRGGNEPAQQMRFWHTLAQRPLTCNDEAFHGLLLFADGRDPAENYDERVRHLKSRRMLPDSFDRPGDEAVTRGTVAVAVVRLLDIEGGWAMRVFGPTPRYSVRELNYRGVYPPSTPYQKFSGAEFVGIIGRVEDFQRAGDNGKFTRRAD